MTQVQETSDKLQARYDEWTATVGRRLKTILTEDKRTGEEHRVKVDTRTVYLDSDEAQVTTQHHKLVHTRTADGDKFTTHMVPVCEPEKWLTLRLREDPETGRVYVRTSQWAMDGAEAFVWLCSVVGDWRAARLMQELLS